MEKRGAIDNMQIISVGLLIIVGSILYFAELKPEKKEVVKSEGKYRPREKLVAEQTAGLEEKYKEMERFNKLFVCRELRIAELEEEIERLGEREKT